MILASASPRRSQLLRELGVPFTVLASQAEEVEPAHLSPAEICQINAYRKARTVAKEHPDEWILGADTLVFLGGRIFGKPRSMDEAVAMLSALSGKTHEVITGVCLMHLRHHQQRAFSVTTQVTFRSLTPEEISDYLKLVHPLDKAGGYGIQEHGAKIIGSIHGSYSNVMGLPLERLKTELESAGVR